MYGNKLIIKNSHKRVFDNKKHSKLNNELNMFFIFYEGERQVHIMSEEISDKRSACLSFVT